MVANATRVILLMILCGTSLRAYGEDEHYMVLFASRNRPWTKPRAHCFATFVKVTERSADGEVAAFQADTISWYPMGERCRLFRPPEQGQNADLPATLQRCGRSRQLLFRWGPYRIDPALYEMAQAQKCRLEAGGLMWQAIDLRSRSKGIAINCVHALTDIDEQQGKLRMGLKSGDKACAIVAAHLRRWYIEPEVTHDWVLDLLPLEGEELIECTLEPCALDYAAPVVQSVDR